jgi:glutathione synthase/RimK-type ligase-like ATP-grasp enzyme
MNKEIMGIMRDKKFSPNHVGNDAVIMKMTAQELHKMGLKVKVLYENNFVKNNYEYENYFSMARNENTLLKLEKLEKNGASVFNSPVGVYNSGRERMVPIFQEHSLPIPLSILIDNSNFDSDVLKDFPSNKVWLKRENHSMHREDVTPIYSKSECEMTIQEFKRRGIKQSVIQENKTGSEIKFYGVKGSDFFSWYYVNGGVRNKFAENDLIDISNKAANVLNLDIYGGDAIISENGDISIIDFNDWPSFAPVKEEASKAIAKLIYDKSNF